MNFRDSNRFFLIKIIGLCFFAAYSFADDLSNEKVNRLLPERFELTKALKESNA